MRPSFTARQGEILAFIHRFTVRHGIAPSFEEIAAHFGTSAPSVNGMIKTLERRELLSRVPGVARSLRVLVPASVLPESEFGSPGRRNRSSRQDSSPGVSPADAAVAAAISVIESMIEKVEASNDRSRLVLRGASAVYTSLKKAGLGEGEALEAARRVAAEAARWRPDGRGTSLRRRRWLKR